jgi:RES domain-containing protein
MREGRRLSEALERCPRVAVRGVWYRSVDGEVFRGFYTKTNPMRPLWGLGAPRSGARFTPKNGPPSLYVAEDIETANREGLQVTLGTPLKPPAGVTRAIYTVEVDIVEAMDLRDPSVRSLLETSVVELRSAWRYRKDKKRPPTQRLGAAVAKCGLAGLIFQSTKGAGACFVVFTDNLKKTGSRLEVKDGTRVLERLP